MTQQQLAKPTFGISITPTYEQPESLFAQAELADSLHIEMLSIQDHPYNAGFLDTWTLLAALGARTQSIRLLPNVANLPLRPPAMLAKAAASLDVLTKGRVEMGLGAGAFWDGIAAFGGPRRTPRESVDALEEAITIMKALWQESRPLGFEGQHYRLEGAQPGPHPVHPIGIWLGALGPRMLRLTGQQADGWIISSTYVPPENVLALQDVIDEAATQAGRNPTEIQRCYNLMGLLAKETAPTVRPRHKGVLVGTPKYWSDEIVCYYRELRLNVFHFWPSPGKEDYQMHLFAEEVIPAVHAALAS